MFEVVLLLNAGDDYRLTDEKFVAYEEIRGKLEVVGEVEINC